MNENSVIITQTINALITLQAAQQNVVLYTNPPNALLQACAEAQVQAYANAINILQSTMEQYYSV